MKKIGFLINTLAKSGGTERVTTVLANALSESGYEVEVICMSKCSDSFYKLNDSVQVRFLSEKSSVRLTDYWSLGRSLIKNTKHLDYIIGVGMDLCVLTVPVKLFNKTTVIGWEHFNLGVRGPVVSLARKLGRWFADRIVTITKHDCEQYLKKTDKVTCIYNPVTIDKIAVDSYDSRRILCVGRLTHQKGFDMMIDMWAGLHERHPGWRLTIVGDGEDEARLKAQAAAAGVGNSLEFFKATREVAAFYKSASIYAMSSRYEGLPLVLIEAQSAGLPLIAFNCETGPKEVITDGYNGYLIPAFDKNTFRDKLETLMKDAALRQQMGRNSVVNSNTFSRTNIVTQWREILV
jgi:amylovoran biosynthesis glycosyltransferase AmsD